MKSKVGIICLAEEVMVQGICPVEWEIDALFPCSAMIVAYSR